MDYRGFEAEFLRLAFTTSYDLSPASTAFLLGLAVPRATEFMLRMVDEGTLELDSDDVGHLRYIMPDRPDEPLEEVCATELSPVLHSTPDGWRAEWDCTSLVPHNSKNLMLNTFNSQVPLAPERLSVGRATAALLINALVCPGMGSMVGGRNAVGIAQMALFMVGLPLAVVNFGLPLLAVAWAWGIFSGAKLVSLAESDRDSP